jgi:hypothetical protein
VIHLDFAHAIGNRSNAWSDRDEYLGPDTLRLGDPCNFTPSSDTDDGVEFI